MLATSRRWRSPLLLFAVAVTVIVLGQLLPRAIARRFAPDGRCRFFRRCSRRRRTHRGADCRGGTHSAPVGPSRSDVASSEQTSERDAIQDAAARGGARGRGRAGRTRDHHRRDGVRREDRWRRDDSSGRDASSIGRDASAREVAEEVATSAFSRVPVYDGTLDRVVGMIHVFDVLKLRGERTPELRPVATALPTMQCSELLFRSCASGRISPLFRTPSAAPWGW